MMPTTLNEFDYKSLQSLRDRSIPEKIYVRLFVGMMQTQPHLFQRMMAGFRHGGPVQRDAQVAVSFVMWLGSPQGGLFLADAPTGRQSGQSLPDAYTAAWDARDQPNPTNSNPDGRVSNIIVSPRNETATSFGVYAPAAEIDRMVIKRAARWLGTAPGQRFIRMAEAQIIAAEAAARRPARPFGTGQVVGLQAPTT